MLSLIELYSTATRSAAEFTCIVDSTLEKDDASLVSNITADDASRSRRPDVEADGRKMA